MNKRITGFLPALLLAVTMTAGCGQASTTSGSSKPADSVAPKPVDVSKPATVKILAGNINDDVFKLMITDPMAQKYPQITIERQKGKLSDLIAAGETPDLITDWNGGVPSYADYDVLADMTPIIKRNNFDLNRFQPVYIDAIRKFSGKGEIYAIPYYAQLNALYYNKNLFDKFGVAYPKDGMTWDDAVSLAAQMTRMADGVQIQGLSYGGVQRLAFPFTPDIVSAESEKPTVNNDVWKRAFELGLRFDSIPGNRTNQDFNKGLVAMSAGIGDGLPNIKKAVGEGAISLGVAQYPHFKEAPDTYGMVDAHYIFITKTSQNPDAAMKVIEVMTSDEVQLAAVRQYARLSPLKNPEMKNQFAADFLPGVDMQSIFKSKPAAGTHFTKYYPKGRDIVLDEYKQTADGKKDVNSALRDAEDRINKLIADDKAGTAGGK